MNMEDNSAQSEIDQAFVEAIFEARLEREIERISVALRTETTKKLDMIQFFLMHHLSDNHRNPQQEIALPWLTPSPYLRLYTFLHFLVDNNGLENLFVP